jgi:hypothetical protein
MRLFSQIGAYSLIINNELMHWGLFAAAYLIQEQDLSYLKYDDDYEDFPDRITKAKYNIKTAHLVCAVLLTVTRIHESLKLKATYIKREPIFFTTLPLVSLAIYLSVLLDVSRLYFDCKGIS